jgi:predicted nuclease of predicted toxin-antitoxin system
MRFLIDMSLSPLLTEWLQGEGHEVVHAAHIGLGQSPDKEIIARARKESRIIVTADLDYTRLLALAGSSSPGIILFRGGNYSDKEMVALIKRALMTVSSDQMLDSIVVIDKKSVRRRRLPI